MSSLSRQHHIIQDESEEEKQTTPTMTLQLSIISAITQINNFLL